MNDPGVVATTAKVLQTAFGDKLRASPPVSASEDFSEFGAAGVPSMMFNIGVYEPERVAAARNGTARQLPPNHSPHLFWARRRRAAIARSASARVRHCERSEAIHPFLIPLD